MSEANETLTVVCDNCGALCPSLATLCGLCGDRLPHRAPLRLVDDGPPRPTPADLRYREKASTFKERELRIRQESGETLSAICKAIEKDHGLAVELANRTRLPAWLICGVAKLALREPGKIVL